MANQYIPEEERRTRRRRTSSTSATTQKRRRRNRNRIRFDIIFLAAITLVVVLAIATPRQQIQPVPTDPPVSSTDPQPSAGMVTPITDPPTQPPTRPTAFVPEPLTFTEDQADLIYHRPIYNTTADIGQALQAKLDWNMQDPDFTVLIIHSHISESYTLGSGETPNESDPFIYDPYRTDDSRYNMIAVGEKIAEILEARGIRVIHDTTSFENPNSDYAYSNAKEHLAQLLEQNPNIGLILDIHRDAVANDDGSQWAPCVTVNGEKAAKISMAISQDNSNPRAYAQNLSFAVKLGAQLNLNTPDIFRLLLVTDVSGHYNQYMGPTTMLIEVGTAGNSMSEALNAAELLANAISELAAGANLDD